MILVVDNYDSFVFNVARYLERLGGDIEVVRNDAVTPAGSRSARTIGRDHLAGSLFAA